MLIFYKKKVKILMKIALFGGSFDPPHNGHNSVVLEA
ncbi:nicotinate-nicotinamide nucleotide adenylyltransferase, partial [Campylobacter jejuni]|nr:nicotinate-nicotinamide nucleotide adenylyltransferase [Campylobacter jejuni]